MNRTRYVPTVRRALLVALAAAILMLPLVGCGASDDTVDSQATSADYDMAVEESIEFDDEGRDSFSEAAVPNALGEDVTNMDDAQRLIIRNLALRLEVESVEDAISEIRDLVKAASGAITDLQVTNDDYGPVYRYEGTLSDGMALSAYVTIRIPVGDANDFNESIRSLGDVLREAEDESDVTQQHIDLSARLRNLQAQEEQLRSFFDKATDVEDLLAVQQELGRVRGEIESLQDRISYLERQASMATITVELIEPSAVVRPKGTDWGFVDAITTGVRALVNTINALIIILLGALPLIMIGLVIFVIIRARLRKRGPRIPPTVEAPYGAAPPAPPTDVNEQ